MDSKNLASILGSSPGDYFLCNNLICGGQQLWLFFFPTINFVMLVEEWWWRERERKRERETYRFSKRLLTTFLLQMGQIPSCKWCWLDLLCLSCFFKMSIPSPKLSTSFLAYSSSPWGSVPIDWWILIQPRPKFYSFSTPPCSLFLPFLIGLPWE